MKIISLNHEPDVIERERILHHLALGWHRTTL
jgi:hypothetical protein